MSLPSQPRMLAATPHLGTQLIQSQISRSFQPDASVVLIGMRVAGKSTLASIVSKTLGWRLIDEKRHFQHVTRQSISDYINKHGLDEYCQLEVELLSSILLANEKSCVIVCSSGCVQTEAGRTLLREYGRRHPVIHVIRDANSVEKYLGARWPGDIIRLRNEQEPVYRSCSNLEFYNMADIDLPAKLDFGTEGLHQPTMHFDLKATKSDSLILKHVERDFVRFLNFIYRRQDDGQAIESLPEWPSSFAVERRRFTYVLPIELPTLTLAEQSMEELESCIDVLQLCVDRLEDPHGDKTTGRPGWEYISEQYAFLRRKTSSPIIYHVAIEETKAPLNSDLESAYFDHLHGGLRLGVEYLMVLLDKSERKIQELIAGKGSTKIIGYFYDSRPAISGGWDGKDRLNWYLKARLLGCDMVQLAQPALLLDDNEAARCFVRRIYTGYGHSPLISAFNTGRLGRPSRIFNMTFTPVCHPALQQPQDYNDTMGTITVQQAQGGLYYSLIYEKLHFFTFGAMVQSALSPALHNAAFQAYGMPHDNCIYQSSSVAALKTLQQDWNFGGCSMSLPYKTTVISMLRSMSTHARIIGAVNTILPLRSMVVNPEKTNGYTFDPREQHNRAGPIVALRGENTDWVGIRTCMLRYLSPANAINSRTTALILGAGGMARAAVYALIRANVDHVFIYNRTYDNALQLADHFNSQSKLSLHAENSIASIDDDADNGDVEATVFRTSSKVTPLLTLDDAWPDKYRPPTIIVSCLPTPDQQSAAESSSAEQLVTDVHYMVPDQWMASPTGGVFLELAYNPPLVSAQLKRVHSLANRGWVGINGLEMLLEGAYVQFELWTGRVAPKAAMRKAMVDSLERRRSEREIKSE